MKSSREPHYPNGGGYAANSSPPGSNDAAETANQVHWFIALFRQGGTLIILVIGLVFAAGKMLGKFDTVIEKQEEQARALQKLVEAREKTDDRVAAKFEKIELILNGIQIWTARIDEKIAIASAPTPAPVAPPLPRKAVQKKPPSGLRLFN